ncbi:MAG: transposase [Ketobacter sp.]|nr:transposase [Ketobacter sp.]
MHNRQSIRLHGYNYANPGYYFITIVTQDRESRFGEVVDDTMVLNGAGKMVTQWIDELPSKFDNCVIDSFVIMPNHIHILIVTGEHSVASPIPSLFDIIGWFKTMTTNEYIRRVKQSDWPPFRKRLWQQRYHDHIIRNEDSYHQIRDYIDTNPMRWAADCLNQKVDGLREERAVYGESLML